MLRKLTLSTRILLLGVSVITCFSLVLACMYPQFKKKMYDARYTKTRHLVESAWGVLDYYADQAKAGAITSEQAKDMAREVVRNLRYEVNDYFWINDTTPRMVMHPIKPDLDGKDLTQNKDPNGKRLFMAMVDTCKRQGAGFVDYHWPKPGEPKPVPKISYVKLFPEWGWIVGSGIYVDDVEREIATATYVVGGVVLVIILGGTLLSYLMARSISRPVHRVVEGMSEGAEQVAAASGQVASSSQQLAEGASEQAASLEETSSSLEEMATMTRQNAENATQANTLMKEANKVVGRANNSMAELTSSMQDISRASEETSKIIKTIDEIAFQTNLLALNAAVEAARAGEAGTGFAVVADEVRNLAMRAADAAKNTADLIEGTVKKVKDGSGLVTKTNEAFSEVAASTARGGELVGEIEAASQEQAQGIEQLNKAVAEMDKVTQQTASNAEQSAGASQEMHAQAERMKSFVHELVLLVGGAGERQNGGAGPARVLEVPKSAAIASQTPARKGNGREVAAAAGNDVRPEQVIPLDDSDFQDF
jgi:methyl-accepting chemotaxis protein